LESELHSASAPLVFIRPVGFTAADSLRLMQAAQRLTTHVRWRLAPAGVEADVYLAHRSSVLSYEIGTSRTTSNSSVPSENSAYQHSRLQVDSSQMHNGHPVCLLGTATELNDDASDDANYAYASLEFPQALEELRQGLEGLEERMFGVRSVYALGQMAWLERARWQTHRMQVFDGANLIAAIEPALWRVHLLEDAPVELIEQGNMMLVPQSSPFGAPGFHTMPLERALWEFAKRCPEPLLEKILPSAYLRERLTHRRHPEMSERELGDHCVAVLSALDTSSRTANELQTALRMSRPALLRALACLALTRSIRPERASKGLRAWLNWLPRRVRHRVFGPSALM
jgi:hypothetical protein